MKRSFTVTMGLFGASSLLALGVAACSGATPSDPSAPGAGSNESELAGEPGGAAPTANPRLDRMMKRFDKNGDGALTQDEIPPRMWGHLSSADADKDGKLTANEIKAHFEQKKKAHFAKKDKNGDGALTQDEVGPKHWEHLKAADTNGDGKVTLAEVEAAHRDGKLGMHKGRHGKHGGKHGMWKGGPPTAEKILAHMDTDKNGTIEPAEARGPLKTHFADVDADKDGHVTTAELKAAWEKKKAEMFGKIDKNGDGFVTSDEVKPERWEHMKAADANGDSKLTQAELEQAFKDRKLGPPLGHRGHGGRHGGPHGHGGRGPR